MALHLNFNNHAVQKRGVPHTLVHCAARIYEAEHLSEELKHLEGVFQANGYSKFRNKILQKHETNQFSGYTSLSYLNDITHPLQH